MAELDVLWKITAEWYILRFRATGDAFQTTLDQVKALPVGMRRWDPTLLDGRGAWWISVSGLAQLARLFRNYAALRAQTDAAYQEWHEAQRRQQEARQQARPSRQRRVSRQIAAAFRVLDLPPSASSAAIKQGYRALAQIFHPDHGGKHSATVATNQAYEVALAYAQAHNAA